MPCHLKFLVILVVAFFQPKGHAFRNGGYFFSAVFSCNRAFPNHAHTKALSQKRFDLFLVPLFVAKNFLSPIFSVCFWNPRLFAKIVSMPKAAVYKNNSVVAGKNNVRTSSKPPVVFSKTKAKPMQARAHRGLGLCSAAFNLRHHKMPFFFCQRVHFISAEQKPKPSPFERL